MKCNDCVYHMWEKDAFGLVACRMRMLMTHGFSMEPYLSCPPQEECRHWEKDAEAAIPKAVGKSRMGKPRFGKKEAS